MITASFRLTLAFLAAGLAPAAWSQSLWMDDFGAAKKLAARTGKDILADFTGSDWCPPCLRMEEEVFTQPEFLSQGPQRFVLLRVDFPEKLSLSERINAQNQQLATRYRNDGLPTFLLMDAKGKAFGKLVGYFAGGPPAFFAAMDKLEAQKAELAKLQAAADQSASGVAKAKTLFALYSQASLFGVAYEYADLPSRIQQEDKDDVTGLRGWFQVDNEFVDLLNSWTSESDYTKAADRFSALADKAKPYPDLQRRIFLALGLVYMDAVKDDEKAKAALKQAIALGPDTKEGLRAHELLDDLP